MRLGGEVVRRPKGTHIPKPEPYLTDEEREAREASKDKFLAKFKRFAKLSKRRGDYASHYEALEGLSRRLGFADYRALNSALDASTPEQYPWPEMKVIREEFSEEKPGVRN